MSIYTSSQVHPYVYKLTHKTSRQFYYGYREANKVPSSGDLGIFYKSSSETIHELGFSNFDYVILAEFYDADRHIAADHAYDFENILIKEHIKNPLCLNGHYTENGKGRCRRKGGFTPETIEKMKKAQKGRIIKPESIVKMKATVAAKMKATTEERRIKAELKQLEYEKTLTPFQLLIKNLTWGEKQAAYNSSRAAELNKRIADKNRKKIIIETESNGTMILVFNLGKWCIDNDILLSSIKNTSRYKNFYKGYKAHKFDSSIKCDDFQDYN